MYILSLCVLFWLVYPYGAACSLGSRTEMLQKDSYQKCSYSSALERHWVLWPHTVNQEGALVDSVFILYTVWRLRTRQGLCLYRESLGLLFWWHITLCSAAGVGLLPMPLPTFPAWFWRTLGSRLLFSLLLLLLLWNLGGEGHTRKRSSRTAQQ